ncbi:hypothetical protein DKK66_20020 (plasmid) [Aquitalea sp. USM4]|nr:hypothetical protein DKK66_20020 [Aquitalea sp. USM4]
MIMEQKVRLINKIIDLCSVANLPTADHRYNSAKRILCEMQRAHAYPADVNAYEQAIRAFDEAFFGKEAA